MMCTTNDDDLKDNKNMTSSSSLQSDTESLQTQERTNDDAAIPPALLETDTSEDDSKQPTRWQRFVKFYWDYEFLILVVVVILLAEAYPPLGAVYLAPQITATWIAVIFIFGASVLFICVVL
jgi:hypothetical protein